MRSETLSLLTYFLGFRGARTSVTEIELELLLRLARVARRVAEIGVFEGATSRRLAEVLSPEAELYLVDPYLPALKVERILGRSLYERVARRETRGAVARVVFVRSTSADAARSGLIPERLDLVFVDGQHGYEQVRADFEAWRARLAPGGVLAFHDSRRVAETAGLGSSAGPVRLIDEIESGGFPGWRASESAGTLSTVVRAGAEPGRE